MTRKNHWETIYRDKRPEDLTWYQAEPRISLAMIQNTGLDHQGRIIDIGGGASTLVDHLFAAGYSNLAVLDCATTAIGYAKKRLGPNAEQVEWYESDVVDFQAPHQFELWHDRAVFHFLTEAADRKGYVQALKKYLVLGGHLIMATFAVGGPKVCSGLKIDQYDADSLTNELGEDFELREQQAESHITPSNTQQKFTYFRYQKVR